METASSMRPIPTFGHEQTEGCYPSAGRDHPGLYNEGPALCGNVCSLASEQPRPEHPKHIVEVDARKIIRGWLAFPQMHGTQLIMTAEEGTPVSIPTMTFDERENHPVIPPHDDPIVVELKVVSALVQRILVDTGGLPILLPGHQETQASRAGHYAASTPYSKLWRLDSDPSWCGPIAHTVRDKAKSRNIEVDFLVVDVTRHTTSSLDIQLFIK
ncbi:hypothetical protein Cgig2_003170 [Carnegiea gigantea]|uniref:Uncharacterized protein n=1 Tax=Carnegiea gigantea TaxID=171969 RepID=A0A9Q1QB58_9CARY|nr:hypothetical protein Cgig2_003170 [Carnegiea gigantea]